jgi:hypothetical protein
LLLYNRKVSVRLADIEISELRIVFSIVNSTDQEANAADVQIYNLSESTRGRLLTNPDRNALIVEAGYDEVFGEIYKGKTIGIDAHREGTSWVLRAAAKDGLDALRQVVNVSLAPGAKLDNAFTGTLSQLGVGVNEAIKRIRQGDIAAGTKTLIDGFVGFGRGMDELDKLTKKIGAEWSIQGEELQIRLPNETVGREIYVHPRTGLVGSPERLYDEQRPGVHLVRFRSLLQPGFRPYARVELDSRSFSGTYRVEKVEHSGDTHGAEWTSVVEAREIK